MRNEWDEGFISVVIIIILLLMFLFFTSCTSLPGIVAKGTLDEGLRHTRPIKELHRNIDQTESKLERFRDNFQSFAQSHRDMVTDMFERIRLIQTEMHEMHQLVLRIERRTAIIQEKKSYMLADEKPETKKEENI